MSVIILFGKPGAGKGTRLSEFLRGREDDYSVLSVGNLLRKARKEGTELGKQASKYMDAGELVPDEIINEIVLEGIKNEQKIVISDGFPRTVAQAEAMINAGIIPDIVIEFCVDDEIVVQRAKDRIVCEACGEPYTINNFNPPKEKGICDRCGARLIKRKDDEPETVRNRLSVYKKETYPVLKVFANANVKICSIDSTDATFFNRIFKATILSLINN